MTSSVASGPTASFTRSIIENAWRFSRLDETLIAPVVRFHPRGIVGGYIHPTERSWDLRDGDLAFLDLDGVATTIFRDVVWERGEPVRLIGKFVKGPQTEHVLDRIKMPSAIDFGQTSRQTQAEFLRLPPASAPRRRNLVVLRANEQSLHTKWSRDLDEADRNWDFCVSWYGRDLPGDFGDCEYFTNQPEDRKFAAIYALFQPDSPLWNYDRVWLPDDDLQISRRQINRLFMICRRHDLQIAQPSLEPKSFVNHEATAQRADFVLRYTNFVEVMCPLFSRSALRVCLPTFNGSISGFGLDHVWPRLLGMVHTQMAIIDDVTVAHTRPMAGSYDIHTAVNEENKLRRLYGAGVQFSTVGGLGKNQVLI